MDINFRRAREIQMMVAAIEAACTHEPVIWSSGSIDGMAYKIMRCKKCGMMNPPGEQKGET